MNNLDLGKVINTGKSDVLAVAAFVNDDVEIWGYGGLNYQCSPNTLQILNDVCTLTYKLKKDHFWSTGKEKHIVCGHQCLRADILDDNDKILCSICSHPGYAMTSSIYCTPSGLKVMSNIPDEEKHEEYCHCQTRPYSGMDWKEEKSMLSLAIGDLTNTKEDTMYTVSLKLCYHESYVFYKPQLVSIFMPKENAEDKEILRIKMFKGNIK